MKRKGALIYTVYPWNMLGFVSLGIIFFVISRIYNNRNKYLDVPKSNEIIKEEITRVYLGTSRYP